MTDACACMKNGTGPAATFPKANRSSKKSPETFPVFYSEAIQKILNPNSVSGRKHYRDRKFLRFLKFVRSLDTDGHGKVERRTVKAMRMRNGKIGAFSFRRPFRAPVLIQSKVFPVKRGCACDPLAQEINVVNLLSTLKAGRFRRNVRHFCASMLFVSPLC
jgi:hypothetical protein